MENVKKGFKALIDVKTILSALLVIVGVGGIVNSKAETYLDAKAEEIKYEFTKPTYKIVQYDLLKQLEKLANAPEDMKVQDLHKLGYFCQDEGFTKTFSARENIERPVGVACKKVLELYDASLI